MYRPHPELWPHLEVRPDDTQGRNAARPKPLLLDDVRDLLEAAMNRRPASLGRRRELRLLFGA